MSKTMKRSKVFYGEAEFERPLVITKWKFTRRFPFLRREVVRRIPMIKAQKELNKQMDKYLEFRRTHADV